MVHEHDIRAALSAEASMAQVPTEAILKRIRNAEAAPRRSRFRDRRWFSQIPEVVAVCAVLALLLMLPFQRGGHVPESVPAGDVPVSGATERLHVYTNDQLGVAIAVPGNAEMPKFDAAGQITVRFDGGQVAISRQTSQVQLGMSGLLAAEAAARADLGKPLESEVRAVGGQAAAYLRFRDRAVYVVPAGSGQYTVQCMAADGTPWAKVQPMCDRIMSLLNIGPNLVVSQTGPLAVTRDGQSLLSITIVPDPKGK